jgi:hypothetical protein
VVARLRWWGTTPSGEQIDRETIDIVRFANGRAFEHWGIQLWGFESGERDAKPQTEP